MVTGFVNRVGRRFASAGHFLCVAIAAGLISPLAGAAPVPLVADAGQPRFSAVAAGRQMTWDFFAALGPDSRPLRLKWVPNGARKWETEVDTDAGPIHISLEASPLGAWTAIELFIRNEQKSLLLCEVGWHAAAALEQSRFWGGWNTVLANRRYEAEGPVKVYPLQAIYDNKASLATALFPSELVSYLRVAGDTSTRPAGLETAVRCVVDPGSQARLNFVLGAFETQWGYLEALHHYYTAFPQWFTPYPGVDPRASLNGGSYLIWRDEPMCDLARRLQVGWEWCYAPFRRTGDIFGRPEFWDYSPARPMAAWRAASIDEVHKWRKQRFAQG
ncbi:MAG: hypothetical protein H5T86_08430, partial [Armatimonadetes bacterium]|nr:hypothetical protein [Armatimonadota bacterium]